MFRSAYEILRMEMNTGSILGYFFQALPAALLVGIVYAGVRTIRRRRRGGRTDWGLEIMRWLFACYLTGLCSLVILPANFWLHVYDGLFYGWWDQLGPIFQCGEVNLVPALVRCFNGTLTLGSWVKQMLAGNVAMLIPFGFFLSFLAKRCRGKRAFASAVVVPIVMETLQLIFGRSFDVDDLICNFLGIIIGLLIAAGIQKIGGSTRSRSAEC